jgi:class 3 adenylate cyclase/tetratricopeptide (TPR) repeat protein
MAQVCPACGAENPEGSRFCNACAAPLTAPVSERRRLATLVFCDLVGSTALGERVDPEAVKELLGLYFAEMRAALEAHGGVVEKFIGDAVVGVFGVPVSHEDDALRACRAALEMRARLEALNPELERRFGLGLEVRIGVNSGGVVGSRETFVTGDAANVAARLEQAAGPGEVLLGEASYRLVRGEVRVEPLGPLKAKGKSEPLTAYRLLELSGARLGAGWETGLVGRGGELALLEREFEQTVAEGRCRLVTVVGEPGVGKSRLVSELAERIGLRARVARGACLSYGEGITFWSITQIVRALAGIDEQDSAEQAREKLPPQLAQLLGLAEGTTSAEETNGAIAEFLGSAAGERPLLVLVDDVHWAEPALLELLERLPALVGEVPLLLVCLARPELLEHRPDWPVTLGLEPLGATEVDALLEQLEAPPSVRVRIAQTAGGNPLFAEELVAWVREGGALEEMPTGLNALLGARLDQLDPEARDALERGAVEGELFHQAAIVELSDEPARPAVPSELGQLARKDLIRLAAAGLVAGGVAYRFKHILVRDAAYLASAKRLRALLHERYADWLEQVVGERVGEYHEIIGYHLEQAYRYRSELGALDDSAAKLAARAAGHLAAAGLRAGNRGDYHAVTNLLERALALGVTDTRERVRLEVEFGLALFETGRIAESEALLGGTIQAAADLAERGLATRALVHISAQRLSSDPGVGAEEMVAVAEEAIETFEALGDTLGLAEAGLMLSEALGRAGRRAESFAATDRALAHAQAAEATGIRRLIINKLAERITGGGTTAQDAIARLEELRDENRDDRMLEAVIGRQLSFALAMTGRFEEARAQLEASTPVLDEADLTDVTWANSRWMVSHTLELVGDTAAAEQNLIAVWHHFRDSRGEASSSRAMNAAAQLALLYCDQRRWDEAAVYLSYGEEVDRAPPVRGKVYTYYRLAARARVAAHAGHHADAVELARTAVELAGAHNFSLNVEARVWLAVAEVQRAAGNTAEADAAVAKALELYEQKGNVAAVARLRAPQAIPSPA